MGEHPPPPTPNADPNALKLTKREEYTLGFTTVAFMTFSIIELIFAFSSNSMALLGDAVAMMVDAFTYMFNGFAIQRARMKGKEDKWAVLGPVISTSVLIGAMIYIFYDAVSTLASGASGDGVDLVVVLAFGLANLAIDIASGILFCAYPDAYRAVLVLEEPESLEADGGMNIRSALTHVVADTYRTIAVLVTASAAMADNDISGTQADAWGAIAVEVPVLVLAVSLGRAAWKRYIARRGVAAPPAPHAAAPGSPGPSQPATPAARDSDLV
jgi:Co/Zn/Cd efflux system component